MKQKQPISLNERLAQLTKRAGNHLAYHWGWYPASAAIVLLISAWYLLGRGHCAPLGYPLDDAWIHQSFARTLAQTGQFAFAPGRAGTGSTSLLWTLLLAPSYRLGLPPVPWSYALGALAWFLTAWTAQRLARRLFPSRQPAVPWVALACLLEWHLAWAALSGMEITLFAYLSILLLERYTARARPLSIGILGGLLVWTRPEGAIVALAVVLGETLSWTISLLAISRTDKPDPRIGRGADRTGHARLLLLLSGLAGTLCPYLVLNLSISGQPFPSTLYAKQAEYGILLAQPLWHRLWVVTRRPLVGAQLLLLPGFVWQAYAALRETFRSIRPNRTPVQADRDAPRPLAALLPLVWWAAHHSIYALQLPVDYQHGRYLMPVLPILLLYGTTGTLDWLQQAAQGRRGSHPVTRIWTRALGGALGVLCLAFLVLGVQAYVEDRCIIHQEMVTVALWLWENTPPNALIAAHDIGAIGYWAERPLLDLAGLINPEVVPIMRDEGRLLEYVIEKRADYLVTFPSWYPTLVRDERLIRIYPPSAPARSSDQREPMTVFAIKE